MTTEAEIVNETPLPVATRPAAGAVGQTTPPEQIQAPAAQITPAQAKIEAVASLTMQAYQRAATLSLTGEESAALQADFPDEAFQPGAAGKENLIYIEHAHLRDRFTKVFGMGQWAIIPRNRWAEPFTIPPKFGKPAIEGQRIYVEAMLVVRGCFVGEAVGAMEYYPANNAQNYGDAVEGAKTAAFRRCAKEFGVGLQAWKKEWCEGWWARRRGQNAPGRAAGSGRVSEPPARPTNPAPAAAQAPAGPKKAPESPKCGTDATRAWMIGELGARPGQDARKIVTEYFQKAGQLLPNEAVEDLPLRYVPVNKAELAAVAAKIRAFEDGQDAEAAFPSHTEPAMLAAAGGPAPASAPPRASKDDEAWRDVIVPIPRKGEKRVDYLKHPDTIGSLFELRHGESEEAQAARQRLWGFVNNYEPKGWQKQDGTQMPPSESDIKFRAALDQFSDWFTRNHPDEKL